MKNAKNVKILNGGLTMYDKLMRYAYNRYVLQTLYDGTTPLSYEEWCKKWEEEKE